jgi:C-terminal processing protease CtpA/Prc
MAVKMLALGLAMQSGEAYKLSYKNANDCSEAVQFDTTVSGHGFAGKLTVLTSLSTGSAAEALIYFFKAGNNNVTIQQIAVVCPAR